MICYVLRGSPWTNRSPDTFYVVYLNCHTPNSSNSCTGFRGTINLQRGYKP